MVLAWVLLDSKGVKVLACSCEEQVALQSSPMEALPFCPSPFPLPGLHGCSRLTFSPSQASSLAAVQPAWCQPWSVPKDPLRGRGCQRRTRGVLPPHGWEHWGTSMDSWLPWS